MSLPQALKPGVIPSNTEQRIDTDILEPEFLLNHLLDTSFKIKVF